MINMNSKDQKAALDDERKTLMQKLLNKKFKGIQNLKKKGEKSNTSPELIGSKTFTGQMCSVMQH